MTKLCSLLLCAAVAAALLWSQRPPTIPYTAAEMAGLPLTPPRTGDSVRKSIFDGESLHGWRGNQEWWAVAGGALRGKSHDKVPTSFLFTTENYSDFRLTLSSKMVESDNHAGVAFWGEITTKGENKWYTQGPLVVFPNPSMWDYIEAKGLRVFKTTTEKVTAQHDWILVEILAQGNRVRTALNGVQVMEWREADPARIKDGPIGLQLHGWTGPQEVLYKDIVVETFPKEDRLLTTKR